MSHVADATDSMGARIGGRVMLGGCLMLLDTVWGAFAVSGIGSELLLDIPLTISLVAGLPAFVLDAWSRSRIIVFLPALYLFRWYVVSHIGPAPYHLSPPWRGSVLLIVASVLLQWAKLQKSSDGSERQ